MTEERLQQIREGILKYRFDLSSFYEFRGMLLECLVEISRLRRGEFTPEEFQSLCHSLPTGCTREAFEKGCREYQDKLFGAKEKVDE